MNVNHDQNISGPDRLRDVAGWVAFLAGTLATSVEVFLHRSRSFGQRYFGLQAAAVILVVPLFSLFWAGHDLVPLMYFLGAYLFMCLIARLCGFVRHRRGNPREHSRYTGYPRLLRILPWFSEHTVKVLIEPMIVFFTGVFTLGANEPLGGYFMLAAVGLFFSVNLSCNLDRVRALDMHDAAIEQQIVAERFRDMREGRKQ